MSELFLPQIFNGFDQKTKSHLRFCGIGPRAGIDTNWHLGYGFSFFGNGSASILYGHFKSRHRETFPPHLVQQISTKGELLKVKHKFHQFAPYANLYMGLAYNRYINKDNQHIALKLGYEVQYYWRINQMIRPKDINLGPVLTNLNAGVHAEEFSEDVMFYGIAGEFRLDF